MNSEERIKVVRALYEAVGTNAWDAITLTRRVKLADTVVELIEAGRTRATDVEVTVDEQWGLMDDHGRIVIVSSSRDMVERVDTQMHGTTTVVMRRIAKAASGWEETG